MVALVNLDLVLERLGPQQTRIGEWVNVIGYITSIHPSTANRKLPDRGEPIVRVQALIIWLAGSLDVQRYETSVDASRPEQPSIGGNSGPLDTT